MITAGVVIKYDCQLFVGNTYGRTDPGRQLRTAYQIKNA